MERESKKKEKKKTHLMWAGMSNKEQDLSRLTVTGKVAYK